MTPHDEPEALSKLHVHLPNHWAVSGESMWAYPLGCNTYELRNVPFHAFGLNYLDVVEAVAARPELKPSILRVVRPSGHRTLRVIFPASTPEHDRVPLLESLQDLGASLEGATKSLFAIDIEPDGNYSSVCDRLKAWEDDGLLAYETCEARIEGSFDDAPAPSDESGGAG